MLLNGTINYPELLSLITLEPLWLIQDKTSYIILQHVNAILLFIVPFIEFYIIITNVYLTLTFFYFIYLFIELTPDRLKYINIIQ